MRKIFNKGFTLLELLIVIGIVGVLAGVVLISFPSASKKAKLANTMQFSDNVRGSLQPDMVAWWKFDETSGTVAKDTWWNQLNSTIYNGATWVEGIKGNALSFDGVDDYAVTASLPIVGTGNFTISAWINFGSLSTNYAIPIWHGIDSSTAGFGILRKPSSRIIYAGWGSSNGEVAGPITEEGVWYYVVSVYNGSKHYFYVNGVSQGSVNFSSSNFTSGVVYFGSLAGNYRFNGLLDDVQISSAALPVAVIQQYYADGLTTHQNLAIK